MQTKRIEIEGQAGTLTIERESRNGKRSKTIRIDSILRNPTPGGDQLAWKTWEIAARSDDTTIINLAEILHQRTEGFRGTNSDIHAYAQELYRFTE
jgi:hypothetical protein